MALKQNNNAVTLLSNPVRSECFFCFERMALLRASLLHEITSHLGTGDIESSDPVMLTLSTASQKTMEGYFNFVERIKFLQFSKMTQVWSLKLLKRTNFLLTYCCSLKETVLLSDIRGFLCCPLKIIGEDPMEYIKICLPWKAVDFTCTAEQLREVRSVASGHASLWHFTFRRNYKDVFLGNRTESAPRDMDCTAERSELAHGTDSCLVNPVTFVTKRP